MLHIIKFKNCESIKPIVSKSSKEKCISYIANSVYKKCELHDINCSEDELHDNDYYLSLSDGAMIMYYIGDEVEDSKNIIKFNVENFGGQVCELEDGNIVLIVSFVNRNCYCNFGKEYKTSDLNPVNQYGESLV